MPYGIKQFVHFFYFVSFWKDSRKPPKRVCKNSVSDVEIKKKNRGSNFHAQGHLLLKKKKIDLNCLMIFSFNRRTTSGVFLGG